MWQCTVPKFPDSQIGHPRRLNLEVRIFIFINSSGLSDEEPDAGDDDDNDESKKNLKTCNKNEKNYDSDVSQCYRYTHTAQLVTMHMSYAQ